VRMKLYAQKFLMANSTPVVPQPWSFFSRLLSVYKLEFSLKRRLVDRYGEYNKNTTAASLYFLKIV
jgi:hypothetical protein